MGNKELNTDQRGFRAFAPSHTPPCGRTTVPLRRGGRRRSAGSVASRATAAPRAVRNWWWLPAPPPPGPARFRFPRVPAVVGWQISGIYFSLIDFQPPTPLVERRRPLLSAPPWPSPGDRSGWDTVLRERRLLRAAGLHCARGGGAAAFSQMVTTGPPVSPDTHPVSVHPLMSWWKR